MHMISTRFFLTFTCEQADAFVEHELELLTEMPYRAVVGDEVALYLPSGESFWPTVASSFFDLHSREYGAHLTGQSVATRSHFDACYAELAALGWE